MNHIVIYIIWFIFFIFEGRKYLTNEMEGSKFDRQTELSI